MTRCGHSRRRAFPQASARSDPCYQLFRARKSPWHKGSGQPTTSGAPAILVPTRVPDLRCMTRLLLAEPIPVRSTSGVKLLNLDTDDKVAAAVVIPPEDPISQPENGTLLQ